MGLIRGSYHGSHSILAYTLWSLAGMGRLAPLAVVALAGLLAAGCAGGSFGQAGFSLPAAADGVQTVADAADALDGHRPSASENAKSAIAATDALGSFVRDISADQRAISGPKQAALRRNSHQWTVERNGKRIVAGSALVLRPGQNAYCQSSAGYMAGGIPSLDAEFGWQGGAFAGGTRSAKAGGIAVWSAQASGAVVQGGIGKLSISRTGAAPACPMNEPAFILEGGSSQNAFELPIAMAFRGGTLQNLSVVDGRFADGATLDVSTTGPVVNGVIDGAHARVATFRTNATGNGTLTITSSGAQYAIADWIVVGI